MTATALPARGTTVADYEWALYLYSRKNRLNLGWRRRPGTKVGEELLVTIGKEPGSSRRPWNEIIADESEWAAWEWNRDNPGRWNEQPWGDDWWGDGPEITGDWLGRRRGAAVGVATITTILAQDKPDPGTDRGRPMDWAAIISVTAFHEPIPASGSCKIWNVTRCEHCHRILADSARKNHSCLLTDKERELRRMKRRDSREERARWRREYYARRLSDG